MCAPEPVWSANGLAMNVAIAPSRRASWPAIMRKKIRRSAVVQRLGVAEVDLVLEVGVFVVALVDAPAQALPGRRSRRGGTPGAADIPLKS